MENVLGKYIKDEDGNVISPITSTSTIFDSEGKNIFDLVYPIGSIYMSVNDVNPGTLFGGTWVAWGDGRVPVGVKSSDSNFNTVEKTGGSNSENYTPRGSNTAVTLTAAQSGVPAHSHGHTIAVSDKAQFNTNSSGLCTTDETGSHTHEVYIKEDATATAKSRRLGSTNDHTRSGPNNMSYAGAHKHTVPNHTHSIPAHGHNITGGISNSTAENASKSHNHTFTGTQATISHLQEYITCYMWKRTA